MDQIFSQYHASKPASIFLQPSPKSTKDTFLNSSEDPDNPEKIKELLAQKVVPLIKICKPQMLTICARILAAINQEACDKEMLDIRKKNSETIARHKYILSNTSKHLAMVSVCKTPEVGHIRRLKGLLLIKTAKGSR